MVFLSPSSTLLLFLDKLLWPMSKCFSYSSIEMITLRSEMKFCVFHIFIPEQEKDAKEGKIE